MIDATHNANHLFRIDKFDICGNLKQLRNKYPKNFILSYININFIRNKLGNFNNIILNSIEVITIAETQLDDSFPHNLYYQIMKHHIGFIKVVTVVAFLPMLIGKKATTVTNFIC